MNYSLNVKSSSIVHTLLSNCVKLLGKVQKLLIKCKLLGNFQANLRCFPKILHSWEKFYRTAGPTGPDKSQVCKLQTIETIHFLMILEFINK